VIVYAVVDDALSPDFPLGDALETFIRREDAERFLEEIRSDDPEIATKMRIEEQELEAGGRNYRAERVPRGVQTTRRGSHARGSRPEEARLLTVTPS
jgi:hypothetical protein